MQAKETNLLKFLSGPKQLIIPIYQRTYSWTLEECEQLWKDILRAGSDDSAGYFIGSIVYVEKGLYSVSSLPKLLVIDGQQRLTTISLLLSAFNRILREKSLKGELNPDKISDYYLMNKVEEGEDKFKLILTQSDKETLFKIVEGKNLSEEDSKRLKENYQYFLEEILKEDLNLVYKGISKLIIIDVSLDREKDNPQLIFESLNSTGLELTQADLIRNYILMGQEKNQQEELYKTFWHPMEKSFGHSEYSYLFDRFMRDYLTIKTGKIPNINDVYSAFKVYSQKFSEIKELVSDIYEFSKYFVNIALDKENEPSLEQSFSDINELKVDVSYPLILRIYQDYQNKIISKDDFVEILKVIESYVFRRAICGLPTNSLNKTFPSLYKEIDQNNYVESFKAVMLIQDSYRRFPDDQEFRRAFSIKDVYNFRNRNYLLRKLENFDRKEPVNVDSFTIEHIMPQNENLSTEWIKDLGENWKEIKEKYLHTIGNLTLTGYNSELSDSPFKKKRDMKGGFKDSPIRLNRYLANLESWNEVEINKRALEINNLASDVWKFPSVRSEIMNEYKLKNVDVKINQVYSLDNHKHLNGEMMQIFEELRKRILNLGSSVNEDILKLYIAYKAPINFVDIIPQKKALRLSLNIKLDEIKDPKGICYDVTNQGRWGNGDIEVRISSKEEIDYAIFLIKQAYDKMVEE